MAPGAGDSVLEVDGGSKADDGAGGGRSGRDELEEGRDEAFVRFKLS